jgi:hypothetical protein
MLHDDCPLQSFPAVVTFTLLEAWMFVCALGPDCSMTLLEMESLSAAHTMQDLSEGEREKARERKKERITKRERERERERD